MNPGKKQEINWDKFGLTSNTHENTDNGQTGPSYGTDGHQPTDANELFAGEQVRINNKTLKNLKQLKIFTCTGH